MLEGRRHRLARARFGACGLCLVLGGACRPVMPPDGSHQVLPARARRATDPAGRDGPRILSALLVENDARTLAGQDAILVVFSEALDPASLFPRGFFVALADGGRAVPEEAVLAPASERDENRTVMLVGDFGDPDTNPPTDVMVVGRVYAERGPSLLGLSAVVEPFGTPNRVVFAHVATPSAGLCPGSALAVRTYWANSLRSVAAEGLTRVGVVFDAGTVHPAGFDDHRLEVDEGREDNVLDLCLRSEDLAAAGIAIQGAAPRLLRVDPGAFSDPGGIASAAVEVEIAELPRDSAVASTVAREGAAQ